MNLEISARDREISVIEMAGDMDMYSSNTLKETVVELWESGSHRLVLDLTGLEYLDSSGVGVLLYVLSSSRKRGHEVLFAGARGAVMKVIELTKLTDYFPLRRSVDEAVDELNRRQVDDAPTPADSIRQLVVDGKSPLFDTRGMYHKVFHLDLTQVRRLANLIAQKAPSHLRDINILEQQISELLKNAVKHGNRNDPAKELRVWFTFTDESARLIVEDEGEGFEKIEEWNSFYRKKIEAYRSQNYEEMMNYLVFRTENSTEQDGGNAMMAAVEYWNEGVVFSEKRNKVAVMRSFVDVSSPDV